MTVSVSMLPAPGARLAAAKLTLFPDEPFVPQLPVPVTTHVTDTPAIAAGTLSAMLKPAAVAGPALVTVIV